MIVFGLLQAGLNANGVNPTKRRARRSLETIVAALAEERAAWD